MDIATAAWYIVELSGARISVVGSNFFKFMLAQYNASETATATITEATVASATIQRARMDGLITYSTLVAPSDVANDWGYIVACISNISPVANRGVHLLSIAVPSTIMRPCDSVRFAMAYAARACDTVLRGTYIDDRPAYIFRVYSDKIWFDMREYAIEITTMSGRVPEQLAYANNARLLRGPYKWTHSSHNTTVLICKRLVAWMQALRAGSNAMR